MSTVYYSMSTVSQHTRWIPEPSPPCGCFDTDRDLRFVDGHSSAMNVCGCGAGHIAWMLARFGLIRLAALVFAVLVVMIMAGWALGWGVWTVRLLRRRNEVDEGESQGLAGFAWHDDEP
ncbi:hypothetical protein [Streptomyces sp. NBC_00203]|uniref:hypothetical protein n=1 Tax=Streptomyces sp. NBC_00203 TaxID=2975680 RepID=UPI00324335F3